MAITEGVQAFLAAAVSGVLAWAAISDVRTRRIPNTSVLTLLALFLAWLLAEAGRSILTDLEAGAIAFVVTFLLFQFRIVGAGDSKLFAAAALFLGLDYLPYFALATVIAGGVLAIGYLASRPRQTMVMFALKGKGDHGRGVPYGVAIAIGGVFAIWAMWGSYLPPYTFSAEAKPTAHGIAWVLAQHGRH
jgi:prepilin peptidase CpaA